MTSPTLDNTSLKISLGISISFFIFLVGILFKRCQKRRNLFDKHKDTFFIQNGGLILRHQLDTHVGRVETTMRIFTAEELVKATNNYHESRIIGEGRYAPVYRGVLADYTTVAIRIYNIIGNRQHSHHFVNWLVAVSQINHRNVVRLLGCCLERQEASLVHELVTNCDSLYDHIHRNPVPSVLLRSSLLWESRMKIAVETAGALAYLHSSTYMPLTIHGDVKTTNILLDDNYSVKILGSEFSQSVIQADESNPLLPGSLGYLDPEYLQSETLTDKSDVYSFGVVLAELLTSQKPYPTERAEGERNLAPFFVRSVEEGCLNQIVDTQIIKERNFETVVKVADLAKRCLSFGGDDRPSMKEVAVELEVLQMMEKAGGKLNFLPSLKETDHLLGSTSKADHVADVRGKSVVQSE